MLSESINSIAHILGNTSLLPYITLWFTALVVDAYCVAFVAEYLYPDVLSSDMALQVRQGLHIFVQIFYVTWVTGYMTRYSTPVSNYLETIWKIKEWHERVEIVYEDDKLTRDYLTSLAAAILVYFYKTQSGSYRVASRIQEISKQVAIVDLNLAVEDFSYPSEVIREAKKLAHARLISTKKDDLFKWIMQPLDEVISDSTRSSISGVVNEPTIIDNSVILIGAAYFFIVEPIYYWAWLGVAFGPIIVSLVNIVMLGPYIFRRWLGNPFDPKRPIKVHNHEAATNQVFENMVSKL